MIDQGAGTNSLNSNTIGFNSTAGVQITGLAGTGNVLTRNYIGTNSTGGTLGNGTGVEVASAGNFIGQLGAGNTIGGNTSAGVSIGGVSATGNQVVGNLIGTNAARANLNNQIGVVIDQGAGANSLNSNTIGFNSIAGVQITAAAGTGNVLTRNYIGTSSTGGALGNATGVYIAASGNTVGGTVTGAGNTIANNSLAAIAVDSGTGNTIRQNVIFSNGQGIVLNSANNANNNQPFLLLTSVTISNGSVILEGKLSLPPFQAGKTYNVDFFASASGDDPLSHGQGQAQIYLGSAAVPTTGSGVTTFSEEFSHSGPLGPLFTSTATSPGDDTSAFAPSLYLVTNNKDSGTGSLREAITYADAQSVPVPIAFSIPGTGPFLIQPKTSLPPITNQVTLDGTTQNGFDPVNPKPLIQVDGSGITTASDGLTLSGNSSGSTVKGISVTGFGQGSGIRVQSNNDVLVGNWLGVGTTSTTSQGNLYGAYLDGASGTTVGGQAPGLSNIIGKNSTAGILISGSNNVVLGNLIGTDAGAANLGNRVGVLISGASNQIGSVDAGNTIGFSGVAGVSIGGSSASGNTVLGNFIGTDAAGDNLDNHTGVACASGGNTIGGTAANTIGLNSTAGISLTGSNNAVLDNFIGTNAGAVNLGNRVGVLISGANNQIGGADAGNTIGFSGVAGVSIGGSSASGNTVLGNFIGTDAAGDNLDNHTGVACASGGNTIGGTAANIIGMNSTAGISLTGSNNAVLGQLHRHERRRRQSGQSGWRADQRGDNQIGHGADRAANNRIGLEGAGNTIGFSGVAGVSIGGSAGATGNTLLANYIGTDRAGDNLDNHVGVSIATAGNTIGGTAASNAPNIIGNNSAVGVQIRGTLASGNLVENNFIGTDETGSDLGNPVAVQIINAPNNIIGGAEGNTIAFSTSAGVLILGSAASGNLVTGNLIGTDSAGTDLANTIGVEINGAPNNTIGGGRRNIIGFSTSAGILISGSAARGNLVTREPDRHGQGRTFRESGRTFAHQGNVVGVLIKSAPGNTIGGTGGLGNTIAFSSASAVQITGAGGNRNVVLGNFIGTNTDKRNLGNAIGIQIGTDDNTIGGTAAGSGNTIGFSTLNGVALLSGVRNIIHGNEYVGTNGPPGPPPANDILANDIRLAPGANSDQSAPEFDFVYSDSRHIDVEYAIHIKRARWHTGFVRCLLVSGP